MEYQIFSFLHIGKSKQDSGKPSPILIKDPHTLLDKGLVVRSAFLR